MRSKKKDPHAIQLLLMAAICFFSSWVIYSYGSKEQMVSLFFIIPVLVYSFTEGITGVIFGERYRAL